MLTTIEIYSYEVAPGVTAVTCTETESQNFFVIFTYLQGSSTDY